MEVAAGFYLRACLLFSDLIFLSSVFLPFHTLAFNIDEQYPIVITNAYNEKDAHFGVSVQLLAATTSLNVEAPLADQFDPPVTTGWVYIGAPKANSTSSNHLNISEPGVIWRCALGSGAKSLCQVVDVDPTGAYDPFDRSLPYRDKKDGGWLGGSMFVGDSDRFVTCASRWINQKFKDLYVQNGICYWIPKSEAVAESEDPMWPRKAPKLSYRLMPLLNKTLQYIPAKAKQQHKAETAFHWAYGQFGFSIHLNPENELISGTPGAYDWMGSVVYYRDTLEPRRQFSRYNAHPGYSEFSEVLLVTPQSLHNLLKSSDYFGYSVTSGKFFSPTRSKNKTQFAAGAPRASELSGKVLVFTFKEVLNGRSEARLELLVEPIEGRDTNKGNHYGSYFGHSLLALDVNGDGFDDLLVGAPLYGTSLRYKRNAFNAPATEKGESLNNSSQEAVSLTKMKSGDEGCVFVYLSTGEEFSLTPQSFCGENAPGARFGMALTSLNDINYDGFNDVAVGAPFENEGRGAVYIYHGGAEYMTLAQKLKPETLDPLLRTFGWSLSVGQDIDGNGYPDLAVGAYESNQVVVYRTIPIVNFKTELSASIPKLLTSTEEFNVTACITYFGHGVLSSVLALWVKLTVDMDSDGKRMVALVDPIDGGAKVMNRSRRDEHSQRHLISYTRRLQIRSDGEGSCYNFPAVRIGSVDSPTKFIRIRQEQWLDGQKVVNNVSTPIYYDIHSSTSDSLKLPVPVVNVSNSKSQFKDFYSKLPLPAGNAFKPKVLVIPVGTICEADGDPICLANLTISAWLKGPDGQIYNHSQPFTLGSADILELEVELENHRETANVPVTLALQWTQPPVVRRLPKNRCEYIAKTSLSCSIRHSIQEHHKETVVLELDMTGVYGGALEDNSSLNFSFSANTSSLLVAPAVHNLIVPLHTEMKPHDFKHESSKIEYTPGNVSIPTFGLTQAFEVGLDGPSSASLVEIMFEIPVGFEFVSGKNKGTYHRLIGVKSPVLTYDGNMRCDPVGNDSYVEEEELADIFYSSSSLSRKKRNVVENQFAEEDTLSPRIREATQILQRKIRRVRRSLWTDQSEAQGHFGGILKLHCDRTTKSMVKTTCLRVRCNAYHFTPAKKAVVEFKLRMFNKAAANLLDISNYDGVPDAEEIDRIASLWIESLGVVRTKTLNGKAFGESGTLQFTSRLQIPPPYELPAWILIVSVAGGLLQFIVVTIFLKKCGFFRRAKRDELIQQKVAEFERRRLISAPNSPSTSSTARIGTNSSSRKRSSKMDVAGAERPSYSVGGGSIMTMAMTLNSPGTIAKQREIPGAVDLNELRRLYEYAYEDQPGGY